ncbi:zinc ribbon domain-containing protein [Bacillus sp. FSL W8-0223]|uniref:zinc ribbon domain-containing protein n=1 Tax=Bacillus sp. FSL W8-0223 TaxID=2954595 RepID=UPI0030FC1466
MYCRSCGAENSDSSNYCWQDGAYLAGDGRAYQLLTPKNESVYCSNCGEKVAETDNYCQSCGKELFLYKGAEREKQIKPAVSLGFPAFQFSYLKKAFIPSISAFILMLILNAALFLFEQHKFDDLIQNISENNQYFNFVEDLSREVNTDLYPLSHPIGLTDVVMFTHLVEPTFHFSVNGSAGYGDTGSMKGTLHIDTLFLLLIFIPIFSSFCIGVFKGRKQRTDSFYEQIYTAAAIGLIYGIFLSVFSLFSGFSFDRSFASQYYKIHLDFHTSYSFIQCFFTGGFIAAIFSLIGMLFARDYRHFTSHLIGNVSFGHAIHQGFSTFIRGLVSVMAVTVIVVLIQVNKWKENLALLLDVSGMDKMTENTSMFATLVGTQLGAFIWNLLHLSPLTNHWKWEDSEGKLTYSLFSGLNSSHPEFLPSDADLMNLLDPPIYLKLAVLIPIFLCLFAGYRLTMKNGLSFKEIAVFSLTYSFFMLCLAGISNWTVGTTFFSSDNNLEQSFHFSLGFHLFGVFIRSLLFSYLFAVLGGYLAKKKHIVN